MSERNGQAASGTASVSRLMSIDALRGFDMFWIIGADALCIALDQMSRGRDAGQAAGVISFFAKQVQHSDWQGFRFYDLIFPLFIFIMGVSMVFSLPKSIAENGREATLKRVFWRSAILFVLGFFRYGGFALDAADIRLMGVLQRIAICYFFAGILFCYFDLKKLITICVGMLVGYWAVMTFVPIRDIQLDYETLGKVSEGKDLRELHTAFRSTTNKVSGKFDPGRNVAEHFDFQFLPGARGEYINEPEGLLSTFPAIATCLLGVFAGFLLRNSVVTEQKKVAFLIGAGVLAVGCGLLWSLHFPIVKRIWTSSFVLLTGGLSAILLGFFYQIVDIWKFQKWCQPFVWMGMNSITIYLLSEIINFHKLAERFVGGEINRFMNRHVMRGSGELLIVMVGLLMAFLLVRFLYQKKIFLRV